LKTVNSKTFASRQTLRARMAEQRRALQPPVRMAAAQGLRRQLETLPEYLTDPRVAGYWARDGELPLNLAVAPLQGRGQSLYLPCIAAQRQLRFAPWQTGDELEPNRYGIPEPADRGQTVDPHELHLVLVPLLAFDRHGHRIGYGGGFYDTSFAFLHDVERPARPLLVGIGYAFQQCDAIEAQDWDVPLDYVATDHELIHCNDANGVS
jgi:5-formyltetrahydrofolate cyclo-ligase